MAKKTPPSAPPPPPRFSSEEGGASLPLPPPLSSILSTIPSPASSPSSSSSSSEFEFLVSLSPTSRSSSTHFCPADDLFYKGQLLPLHLSPRLTMVRTLLLSSESSSSSSTTTTSASRDSSGSSADSTASFSRDLLLLSAPDPCGSRRPSSAADDDPLTPAKLPRPRSRPHSKYLSSLATKFSSVFHRSKKDHPHHIYHNSTTTNNNSSNITTTNNSGMKEVIKKCVRKVKPLYEKISSSHNHQHHNKRTFSFSIRRDHHKVPSAPQTQLISSASSPISRELDAKLVAENGKTEHSPRDVMYKHSFSGNLRYPRRKLSTTAASCPSSIRSSPSHSGLLVGANTVALYRHAHSSSSSASMEELQNAIQGAIAHCKSTIKRETPPPPPVVVDQI